MVLLQLEEQPPIIQAIFAGVLLEVQDLIEYKQDVNCLDEKKRTPLHAAAFKGDSSMASVLIQNGARVNAKDSKWITPLHMACTVGSEDMVALLLSSQADVSARDKLWQTPLHIAAANDAIHCVEMLLDYVPNLNVTDRTGRTALHHACHNGHSFLAELLIRRGCIVNACDKMDCRPLHCAVQMGHIQTVEVLIKYEADINCKDRNLYTPLHVASAKGMDTICKLLLTNGAEINAQNSFGNTPLHIACLNGHLAILKELIAFNADLEAVNFRGQTPLHIAAASTHGVECLNTLIQYKIDINKQSTDGRTPLHMTALHGRFTRSKTLLDSGALVDCADKNGSTPLHIAAQYGYDLLATTLLAYKADPNRRGYEGRSPLHMCCLSGYVECCRKFIQAGVDLGAVDDSGKTAVHCAAYKGSIECLDLLVSNGADILIQDGLKRLPVHYAACQGHYQCVFTLVGIGSPTNTVDLEGCTPLHLAAGYDMEGKCVEYLLHKHKQKADALVKDVKGFNALQYAIAGGNLNAVQLLLALPVADALVKDVGSVTPLHLAAKNGDVEILRAVLAFYQDVNVQTSEGYTALILAAREGHAQCVHLLLRFGAKVAICDNLNKMTPVHYSARNGHSQCLFLLLYNSEDPSVINALDNQNRTALMLAVSGNHFECVQNLLKCNADPNIVDNDQHSCLFQAVVNGQANVVQLLLFSNAKVQTVDVHGKNVLHLAAACGDLACLQMILNYMTDDDVLALDNQQCSALHWACYHAHSNCLEQLLQKQAFKELAGNPFSAVHCATFSGSEKCLELLVNRFGSDIVNLKDSRSRTPLHLAAIHGHVDCAKFLIEHGAASEVFDEEGRTPLIAAAQFGQVALIEILLNCPVDRSACDKNGNTALHWACLKKFQEAALVMLEDGQIDSAVNIANNEKKTPLHLSARNGLVDVTRQLLKKGASVLAVDSEGLTPVLSCAPNGQVAQCLALILQSLPEFVLRNQQSNDPLALLLFYERKTEQVFGKSSECSQTDLTMLCDPDLFELKKLFGVKGKEKKKKQSKEEIKSELGKEDCFLIEKIDFDECSAKEEEKGFHLHKALSDISIVSGSALKRDQKDKKRACRECFRLQHRCAECNLRHTVRHHMQGKTSQKEFTEFILKALSEPKEKQRFLKIFEDVGMGRVKKGVVRAKSDSVVTNRGSEMRKEKCRKGLEGVKNGGGRGRVSKEEGRVGRRQELKGLSGSGSQPVLKREFEEMLEKHEQILKISPEEMMQGLPQQVESVSFCSSLREFLKANKVELGSQSRECLMGIRDSIKFILDKIEEEVDVERGGSGRSLQVMGREETNKQLERAKKLSYFYKKRLEGYDFRRGREGLVGCFGQKKLTMATFVDNFNMTVNKDDKEVENSLDILKMRIEKIIDEKICSVSNSSEVPSRSASESDLYDEVALRKRSREASSCSIS